MVPGTKAGEKKSLLFIQPTKGAEAPYINPVGDRRFVSGGVLGKFFSYQTRGFEIISFLTFDPVMDYSRFDDYQMTFL